MPFEKKVLFFSRIQEYNVCLPETFPDSREIQKSGTNHSLIHPA